MSYIYAMRTGYGIVLLALALGISGPGAAADRPAPVYVGTATCLPCHAKQHQAWQGSTHERAMQVANERTILGNFNDARFVHGGVTSRFFRRDGRFFVNTDGPGGKLADFEIKFTFGVHPLQQYLLELPGGRLQALGIAWDSRAKTDGGQRWFHLYPDRKLKAGDPLHWTGIDQTWNYQCADCHSTNLRKNYDEASGTYRTSWTDINVGCEACHGPASNHVAWAKSGAEAQRADAGRGLTVALAERAGVSWAIDAATGNAARSRPRTSSREIEACARCHSRRGQFSDTWHPGQALGDGFRISLIESDLYYADGQMRDEVYNHGSFLQSRMHAKGVTCSDCHEPHSQKLRAQGNAMCGQCHAPARYDVNAHHRHAQGSQGAQCVACHMPTTTYMVVDPRHDHSLRIPRPDRTITLGTPNACGACHARQGAKWAAEAINRWYPQRKPGFQTFAEALAAGERGAPGAQAALAALLADPSQSAFARASAIGPLARHPDAKTLPVLAKAIEDPDPLVRAAAARELRQADPSIRANLLPKLLEDPVRTVRMEAARGLAGPPERRLSGDADRARFDRALAEYRDAARFNADRPEAWAELGDLELARGQPALAIDAYRKALQLDPTFVAASVNLADLYRSRMLEKEAESVLLAAIKANPTAAPPRYALGLSYARQKRPAEALAALGEAARLAPDNVRFAYVYAVALHDAGKRAEATRVLEKARVRAPYDRDVLFALATYERETGNSAKAAERARLLVELEPDNADVARFARELGAAGGKAPPR